MVGKVGCGKSSFLAALAGELHRYGPVPPRGGGGQLSNAVGVSSRLGGVVYAADRELGFGLASQEPWIQHATIRDNILFGKDYDAASYQAVVEACALSDDLHVSFSSAPAPAAVV